jgi:hypothetical protein
MCTYVYVCVCVCVCMLMVVVGQVVLMLDPMYALVWTDALRCMDATDPHAVRAALAVCHVPAPPLEVLQGRMPALWARIALESALASPPSLGNDPVPVAVPHADTPAPATSVAVVRVHVPGTSGCLVHGRLERF